MATSMYNSVLLEKAPELAAFVKDKKVEVDLSGFKVLSEARATAKGKTARKNWSDSAHVVKLEDGTLQTIGTINAHTIATGDGLGAMGYVGTFSITANLVLTHKTIARTAYVSLADIVAAAKAKDSA